MAATENAATTGNHGGRAHLCTASTTANRTTAATACRGATPVSTLRLISDVPRTAATVLMLVRMTMPPIAAAAAAVSITRVRQSASTAPNITSADPAIG